MPKKSVFPYKGIKPTIADSAFIAAGARLIGNVEVGANASVWFNTVVRGDVQPIKIGEYTNIQDNCTMHPDYDTPCVVGSYVTVGHNAILHGCSVGDNCLIGMGAIVLSYSEIGENCIIGAGTLIPERKKIPPNSLVIGSPGKVVRTVTPEEVEAIRWSAKKYAEEAHEYMED